MYTTYFGLREPPFSITPDPRYLYMSEGHREALAHLLYGIGQGGGFVQLTGEVGTGKTTLCRALVQQLPPHVDVAFILNPRLTATELLATVCDELRIPYPAGTMSLKVLVDALYQHLLSAHAQRRRTVLIIDEAQDLVPEVLEQVRLLTNLETAQEKLLQVILVGQPELVALLKRRELRQIAQRITARYHLSPFSAEDTRACIVHRVGVAGQSRPLFTEAAIRHVHRRSGGVPRLISVICDRGLLGAYAGGRAQVGVATARRAATEVFGRADRSPDVPWPRWVLRLSPIMLAVVAVALVWTGTPAWIQREARAVVEALPAWRQATPNREASAAPAKGPSRSEVSAPATPSLVGPGTETLVAAAPAAPASAPASPEPGRSRLMTLLASSVARSDKPAAFSVLFARWGLDYDISRHGLACERSRIVGLRCLFRMGGWQTLRALDLPAVIELTPPGGTKRYATVTSLGPDTVTLTLGREQLTLPVSEVDDLWDGIFVLLWKPPVGSPLLKPGTQGPDIEWLRRRIGDIDGRPADSAWHDVYDDGLRQRVMAFQASRSLAPDGLVGEETFAHLAAGEPGRKGPSLSRPDP